VSELVGRRRGAIPGLSGAGVVVLIEMTAGNRILVPRGGRGRVY